MAKSLKKARAAAQKGPGGDAAGTSADAVVGGGQGRPTWEAAKREGKRGTAGRVAAAPIGNQDIRLPKAFGAKRPKVPAVEEPPSWGRSGRVPAEGAGRGGAGSQGVHAARRAAAASGA